MAIQDLDLSAVFMRNWTEQSQDSTQLACQWEKDWEDVQIICKQLDVPCRMVSLFFSAWLWSLADVCVCVLVGAD
jgi:tRNA U34 2-thiouridine synthase MnmA/TrmU